MSAIPGQFPALDPAATAQQPVNRSAASSRDQRPIPMPVDVCQLLITQGNNAKQKTL